MWANCVSLHHFSFFSVFLPPANKICESCFYTCLSVTLFTGGEYLVRYTPPRQVHPRTRYNPGTSYTPQAGNPWDQAHPQAGTPPDQAHPSGRDTQRTRYTLPRTRYTLCNQVNPLGRSPQDQVPPPQDQVHPLGRCTPPGQIPPGRFPRGAGTPPPTGSRYTPRQVAPR